MIYCFSVQLAEPHMQNLEESLPFTQFVCWGFCRRRKRRQLGGDLISVHREAWEAYLKSLPYNNLVTSSKLRAVTIMNVLFYRDTTAVPLLKNAFTVRLSKAILRSVTNTCNNSTSFIDKRQVFLGLKRNLSQSCTRVQIHSEKISELKENWCHRDVTN